jgi:hypothetical protein
MPIQLTLMHFVDADDARYDLSPLVEKAGTNMWLIPCFPKAFGSALYSGIGLSPGGTGLPSGPVGPLGRPSFFAPLFLIQE